MITITGLMIEATVVIIALIFITIKIIYSSHK